MLPARSPRVDSPRQDGDAAACATTCTGCAGPCRRPEVAAARARSWRWPLSRGPGARPFTFPPPRWCAARATTESRAPFCSGVPLAGSAHRIGQRRDHMPDDQLELELEKTQVLLCCLVYQYSHDQQRPFLLRPAVGRDI
jgi:hypothetical protein